MDRNRWQPTKNPFRLIAARIRYTTGSWVEDFIDGRDDKKSWSKKKNRVRYAIWEYGVRAESASNCIYYPLLGKIVKWADRHERTNRVWYKLYRKGDKTVQEQKLMDRLWKKMQRQTDKGDKWRKFEDPDYITRIEAEEDLERRMEYRRQYGESPNTPPLTHGGKRFTQEEWDALDKEASRR